MKYTNHLKQSYKPETASQGFLQLPLTDLNPAYLTVCVWKHETHLRKTPAFLLFAVFLIVIISRPSLPRCHYGGAEVHSVSLEADTISEVLLLYFN